MLRILDQAGFVEVEDSDDNSLRYGYLLLEEAAQSSTSIDSSQDGKTTMRRNSSSQLTRIASRQPTTTTLEPNRIRLQSYGGRDDEKPDRRGKYT